MIPADCTLVDDANVHVLVTAPHDDGRNHSPADHLRAARQATRPSTGCPHRPGNVDKSEAAQPKFVDKAVVRVAGRPISFGLPEGAGGTDAGPMSNHRTGSP